MADFRDPHERHERREPFRLSDSDERWLQQLNDALADAPLDRPATAAFDSLPVIYIVGAPRSGTTLLSQLCSRHLPVGYIDNLTARFWARPSVGLELSRIVLGPSKREAITFASTHGVSSGVAGPHEFGRFWRHWLQLDRRDTHHLDAAAEAQLDRDGLRRTLVEEMLAVARAPMLFKNVICGFHAAWLTTVHRPSLFIHIERSIADTAASILRSRIERYGSADAWWSLKPSTFEAIAALDDPAAQVVQQVIDCRREFRNELSKPGVSALHVTYADLCRQPSAVLGAIAGAVAALGYPIEPLAGVPAHFEQRPAPELPAPLDASLQAALRDSSSDSKGTR